MNHLQKTVLNPLFFVALWPFLVAPQNVRAQSESDADADGRNVIVAPELYDGMAYRSLNFSRGGRSTAVAGVIGDPQTYYFGASGGGLWKTKDAGISWSNVSDEYFGVGSIGAIAVSASDSNIVYVGTGSACPRGNVSPGDGMYKSTDAGKTWEHIGLRDAGQIGGVKVHPKDPDLVYIAAVGQIFGPNEERGIFRSRDGGETWEKVFHIDDRVGANDIEIDPNNPRVLFASMWTFERKPWTLVSGGEGNGIYRSQDGGDTWEQLTEGLPTSVTGKTAVAVSPVNSDRVWALVEASEDEGGVFRSDDGGDTWRRTNDARNLQQRAWYYIHIYADPQAIDTVYALNTGFYKSMDGGVSFGNQIEVPHGDNHDLWINPENPQNMINANDGGANVTFTGGAAWTGQMNQPTSEIYRVTVDTRHPYRVYGAQQDNSTTSVSSRAGGRRRGAPDFYSVGGGESGHIAVDPRNPNIVYAGSYGGSISRMDTDTRLSRSIVTYPESSTGQQAADMQYRFQWNAPIRISPHDPDVVYHTSQYVHRTRDGGFTWEIISPDLTHNDPETLGYAGGPITRDNTGVEVYNTIFSFEESPHSAGLLWAGSDDGRVHISRDDGASWDDITPKKMPESGTVNSIDLSAHDAGRAHIAVYRYRENDFRPYIFRTDDYGKRWKLLTGGKNGIPKDHFVRVVREDPDRQGLLYAGTEFGLYVSFDDGAHWQSLQLELPIVPVTDMLIHRQDLVVATQGRGFYILDNLLPLHQFTVEMADADVQLFAPRRAYRGPGESATIDFYLAEKSEEEGDEPDENSKESEEEFALEILDMLGNIVNTFTAEPSDEEKGGEVGSESSDDEEQRIETTEGLNRFAWNFRYKLPFKRPDGIVMWGGGDRGPKVVPGTYQVRLSVGDWSQTQTLVIERDPRLETTQDQFEQQLQLAQRVGERLNELWTSLGDLRTVKKQTDWWTDRLNDAEDADDVRALAEELVERLTEVEGDMTQLQGEANQDALNFPGRLDNQWATLYSVISNPDSQMTEGSSRRFEDLNPQLDDVLDRLRDIYDTLLVDFNDAVQTLELVPVPAPSIDDSDSGSKRSTG